MVCNVRELKGGDIWLQRGWMGGFPRLDMMGWWRFCSMLGGNSLGVERKWFGWECGVEWV